MPAIKVTFHSGVPLEGGSGYDQITFQTTFWDGSKPIDPPDNPEPLIVLIKNSFWGESIMPPTRLNPDILEYVVPKFNQNPNAIPHDPLWYAMGGYEIEESSTLIVPKPE